MSRRTTELLLLIAAAFPVTLLYALYVVNAGAVLSFQTLAVPLGLFAAFAAAHIGVRLFAPGADPALLPIVFALSGIGITFVTRLEPSASMGQIIYLFLGVALMVGTLAVVKNLDVVKRYKYVLGAAGIALLVLPMLIGTEIYGSKLWIKIGSFQFQPGEFAKVFIVLFLAGYLAENRELLSISNRTVLGVKLPRLRLLYPLFIVWGVCLLVVAFERDLGSALLFYTIFLIMLYVATGRVSYVLIGLVLLAVGAFGMYQIMGHVQVRVAIWLDPFKDAQNLGFQIVQALYSLADGGLLGVGIGKGLGGDTIPVVASDMIFAAIGEEMGLLGGAAVLLLFMLFAVRGLTTAARAKSDLAAFSAAGLTAAISFQAFTIVGGVTKLIPLTGVTLPFMSQGGSSLLASFVIVALLLRAGDEATGRSTEIANTSTELTPVGYRPGGSRGSHVRRPALDTPESGLLGRVALANRLTRTVFLFTALFAVLIGNLTYIQVFKASEYQDMPSNNHTITKARYIKRGSIITADGLTLAESIQQEDGTYVRSYPNGNLAAHAVGYYSQQYGSSGVESSQDKTLTGSKDYSSWQNALNSLAGITEPGNSVQLTIDSRIQQAAEQALAGRKGAIVVLDPRTGAVLAWASAPAYDNTDIAAAMEAANASGGADTSMFDRATQALYSPGSTFKTVTLSSALENGVAALSSTYSSPGRMEIGGADVVSVNEQGHGTITLDRAFAVSSNTVFGQVAEQLGADRLVATAQAFGYGQNLGIDFSTAVSIMPDPADMSTWELAWAGAGQPVGQGHTPGPQTTVMQNAVIAAAIANNGIAMNPYVVGQILAPDGTVIKTTRERSLGQAVSSGTAEQVKEAMLDVVQNGSGSAAGIAGVKVAGKTGTAETNSATPNSTFIGFAPYDTPTLAVSLVLEETTENEATAAAVAGQVLRAALAAQGM
ncbi:FtsW/RodA/SpoVE family cell cycle protein [Collinsella stercoris]|uniref:Penicillin-binding protein, transpeptidase domain protein n=1 Tax=Collinsella stercoris DSM 13279 TaxID=445975 RepID=B6GE27_9ACTN|nr:FtsW/RodA/SpoVE family cell cycle protein [Collinsella stercoris]EEA89480.1 penicillin-binding protein, transpeptidase domain protein [Collinsella stercoris DSM 13279]UEA45051.1 FtsW/RodA/SpoVE family cell cycle protein [Collinsella stercoris DSM 13279]UWP12426.1 FtsW/RodA/SpoVE family cell cycle protein [Collinsella stercoris]